jgi:hypothetical protein
VRAGGAGDVGERAGDGGRGWQTNLFRLITA